MISRASVFSAALLFFSGGIAAGRAQADRTQASPAATSHAQSDSLGDAARKARAQKPHSTKPAKVFTNDDVQGLKYSFSGKGQGKAANHGNSAKATQQQR